MWITVAIAISLFFTIFIIAARTNRATCIKAYTQGCTDVGDVSWSEIQIRYRSYLRPMRPMDAASYQRGIEFELLREDGGRWQDLKKDFLNGWSSKEVLKEGNIIREIGSQRAADLFKPRVTPELYERILGNPDYPPLLAKFNYFKICKK